MRLLIFAFFLIGVPLLACNEYASHEEIDKARELIERGQWEEAQYHLKNTLAKLHPDDKKNQRVIYQNLAFLYARAGIKPEALDYYRKALDLCTVGSDEYHVITAKMDMLQGLSQQAIQSLKSALEVNPKHFEANASLGLIYMGKIRSEDADFDLALPYNMEAYRISNDASSLYNLANNFFFLGNYYQALPLFERYHKTDPQDSAANYCLGIMYWERGRKSEARERFKTAFAGNPSLRGQPQVQPILGQLGE